MSTKIVKAGQQSLAVPEPPQTQADSLLTVIAQAATDPRCDIDKMERLLAMQQAVMKQQREQAFMSAMARVAPLLPQMPKYGKSHTGKYALLEDIDRIIRPIISAEGFSLSFDSQQAGTAITITCKLSHTDGHSETKSITLPPDKSGSKNESQAVISAISYGRRVLTKMFFNLVEAGEDDDGNGGSGPISEEQELNIDALISETKTDRARFLKFMGVGNIGAILSRDFQKAVNALETKRRSGK